MKAARSHRRRDIGIEDIPEPVRRPGTVAIDGARCGICGADVREYLEGPILIPAAGHPHPLSHAEEPLEEVDLRGTIAHVRDHPATTEPAQDGRIDPASFISARIPPHRLIEDGFETLIHHNETAVEIVIHP